MSDDNAYLIKVEGRLSYPHLFEPYKGPQQGTSKAKYSTKLLIDRNSPAVKEIVAKIKQCANDKWMKNGKSFLPPADKLCLRDGKLTNVEEEAGSWILSASEDRRPYVLDRNRDPLSAEDDDKIYPGAVVIAVVRLWAQDNQFGKRVNANLIGVQFKKHGERIAGRPVVAVEDAFEDLGEDEEAGEVSDDDTSF